MTRFQLMRKWVQPDSFGAEIGVERGDFAEELLALGPRRLYLVDSWERYRAYESEAWVNNSDHELSLRICKQRFSECPQVRILRGFSTTVALCEDIEPLDWFYLDANHRYEFVLCDLVAWSRRLKPSGFIAGHDYNRRPQENYGVIEAVNEFCRRFEWHIADTTDDVEPICSYVLLPNTS